MIPNHSLIYYGQITRYDTLATFNSTDSYSVFNTTAINANSKGFIGAIFDGRYIYFVPYYNDEYFGLVTRYDTTSSFISESSYTFLI